MPESTKHHIARHLEDAKAANARGDMATVQHHVGHVLQLARKGSHAGPEQPRPSSLRDRLKGMKP